MLNSISSVTQPLNSVMKHLLLSVIAVVNSVSAIDEDKNDSIYNYVYEIGVEKIPTWLNSMIKIIIIICIIIIVLVVGIISLKKYKKRIK
jgi:1,4-dihydroxy-2-naphthoate octaprenyltransferase